MVMMAVGKILRMSVFRKFLQEINLITVECVNYHRLLNWPTVCKQCLRATKLYVFTCLHTFATVTYHLDITFFLNHSLKLLSSIKFILYERSSYCVYK